MPTTSRRMFTPTLALLLSVFGCQASNQATDAEAVPQQADAAPSARNQPGTELGIYVPEQHGLYDGRFRISGSRIYQVGALEDSSPWDHMGDDASNLREVSGTIELDVDEIANSGSFRAELDLPEGRYVVDLDEVVEFNPCQDGGIAAFLFEHGDAGCGDANWPKSLLYVAGWGTGSATLNDETLYEDYQIQLHGHAGHAGPRDATRPAQRARPGGPRPAPSTRPPSSSTSTSRSPEENPANHPKREVFDHFFAMEVTWK